MTMRKLYLVPIIHTRSDMGSISSVLSAVSIKAHGEEFWNKHQQTVEKFGMPFLYSLLGFNTPPLAANSTLSNLVQ